MNHMNEVAKMLGVELGERFKIVQGENETIEGDYCLLEDGLHFEDGTCTFYLLLNKLLTGECQIVKLPFKPKYNDDYYYYLIFADEIHLTHRLWENGIVDYLWYAIGNCFRTEEEAKAHKGELLKKLKRMYEDE